MHVSHAWRRWVAYLAMSDSTPLDWWPCVFHVIGLMTWSGSSLILLSAFGDAAYGLMHTWAVLVEPMESSGNEFKLCITCSLVRFDIVQVYSHWTLGHNTVLAMGMHDDLNISLTCRPIYKLSLCSVVLWRVMVWFKDPGDAASVGLVLAVNDIFIAHVHGTRTALLAAEWLCQNRYKGWYSVTCFIRFQDLEAHLKTCESFTCPNSKYG